MKRLFLAITPSEDFKKELDLKLEDAHRHPKFKNLKWLTKDQWQIITHHLGECPEHLIAELIELSRGATGRMHPFTLKAKDLTLFPRRGKAHSLWATFEKSLDFETLVEAQVELISPFLKDRENQQETLAHIALARLKEPLPPTAFHQKLSTLPLIEVSAVNLFELIQTPEGPDSKLLESFPI